MQRLVVTIVLVLAFVYLITADMAARAWMALPKEDAPPFVMPSPLVKIAALEFDGLASDFLFLKAFMFIGSTLKRTEIPRITQPEWKWFSDTLNAATDLDPYFEDPYYVGNANLIWDGGKIQEANVLLEKGNRYRTWDPEIPFYLGFNYFYFLKDNKKASQYLMEAAQRPGASPVFASLAIRLAYMENRTESTVAFLEELVRKTEDKTIKKKYQLRLEAFRAVIYLEQAMKSYRGRLGKRATTLEDLIREKIIVAVPRDPYGGAFYIDHTGAVRSTSDENLAPRNKSTLKKN